MENHLNNPSRAGRLTQGLELLALHRITELIGTAVHLETTLANILKVLQDTLRMERATLLDNQGLLWSVRGGRNEGGL